MNNDSENLFLIIIAFIAGFIILQLRRTLGRKGGYDGKGEKSSENQFKKQKPQKQKDADNVIPLHSAAQKNPQEEQDETPDIGIAKSSPFYETLEKVKNYDQSFSVPIFLDGAEYAYGMILNAFWNGESKTLRNFLSRDVFGQFDTAINEMKEKGTIFHNKLNDVEKIELEDASIEGSMAEITLRFNSHMTIAIKDQDGKLIEGDDEKIVPVVDIWTFCRDVNRGDPNWTLVSTSNA